MKRSTLRGATILAVAVGLVVASVSVGAARPPAPRQAEIAFHSNRAGGDDHYDIYTMDAGGQNLTRLTSHPIADFLAAWSRDGKQIAFVSRRDGNDEIYKMNADGTGLTRLTNNSVMDGAPTWSPNGKQIAFHSLRDGNHDIYKINADGTGLTRLTDDPAIDFEPTWR